MKTDQNTEERILAAARIVFIRKGMDGARMQDIADEAGINKALLHYYFRNKEQLFERIFQEAINRFVPRVRQILVSEDTVYDKIRLFCAEYIQMALENPYIPVFIIGEVNKQPAQILARVFGKNPPDMRFFAAQLETEIKAGKIIDISPVQLIMNMMSMCIFPFLGRPIFQTVLGMDDLQFRLQMEHRKTLVPEFIFQAIRK